MDLVGDDKMKASASVKHLLLPGHYSMRTQLVADVISCYGRLVVGCAVFGLLCLPLGTISLLI